MKLVKRFVPLLLVCAFLMATPAAASDRASDQIVSYYITAGAIGNGQIAVDFMITSPGNMKELGAQNIYVFEITGTGFLQKAHYTTADDGMISTNTWRHSSAVIFNGVAGKEYYITASVYAEDYNGGSDSRSKSFTVTAT